MADKARLIREAVLAVITVIAFVSAFLIEDLWFVSGSLISALIAVLFFCYWLHEVGVKWRWFAAIFFTALFLIVGLRFRYNHFERERENVRANLRFKAAMASNLRDSVVTVGNGGNIPIRYKFLCKITMLVPVGGRGFIKNSLFIDHVRSGVLGAGSDAQADDCLSDIPASVGDLDCVDIKVRLFYSLEDRPLKEEEESHGFIARRRGNKFEWEDRASKQEVSDCERFVTRKFISSDDRLEALANTIKVRNNQLLETIGVNPEKKEAALLSLDVMAFGESIKDSKPKEPDIEKEGFNVAPEYQKKFMEWGTANAKQFHQEFDSKMNHVFRVGRTKKIKFDEVSCSIISQYYPPTVDQTRRCGIALGQLAEQLSLH